ncbi:hypothetical protein ANN_18112 [Periplaneta americana]|uniref:Uncharacterized protein n=1 Tax=Periplaneta americana TaxID=6978 RepID=A0ABQ8SP04_PERAM|nr:hypothetical protein ANN_18112 [Periplaneta americana]
MVGLCEGGNEPPGTLKASGSNLKRILDDAGANPNVIIPKYGISPFHLAIGNDCEEFAENATRLFLQHGGNPNVR